MESVYTDIPGSALTRARKRAARWILRGYVILSVVGLTSHTIYYSQKSIPINLAYFIPTAGIGLGAIAGLILLRRSLKQGMVFFTYVAALCVLAILAHEIAVGADYEFIILMYYIGIFSVSLVLGFKPGVVFATFVTLIFFALEIVFGDKFESSLPLSAITYAAALPGRVIELYVEESTMESTRANERLRRENKERREAEERLCQRNRELALITRATQAFVSTLAIDEVLTMILEEIRNLLDVDLCSIWLLDDRDDTLVCRQVVGPQDEKTPTWQRIVGTRVPHHLASQQTLQNLHLNGEPFKEFYQDLDVQSSYIFNLALRVKGEDIGLLQIACDNTTTFGTDDLTLLESLAASAAVAIEHAHIYEDADKLRMFNHNIVQSMGEGVLLVDEYGEIRFVNLKMAVMLNQRPEALVGQHWESILVSRPPHSFVKSRGDGQYEALVTQYETELRSRQGRAIPVIVSARPLYENKQLLGTLAVFTDISQLKAMEEALRQRNKELSALNDIATIIGQSMDIEETFEAMLTRTIEALQARGGWIQILDPGAGNTLKVKTHHDLTPKMIESLDGINIDESLTGRVMQSGQATSSIYHADEEEFNHSNGWTEDISWACVPLKSREQAWGILGVLREDRDLNHRELRLLEAIGYQLGVAVEKARLTEKAAELEILREVDRLRSELVANVSHELRTPLGLIKVFSSTLLREDIELDPEMRIEFLNNIDEETDNLERIVDNLLELGRMESGQLRIDRFPTDLGLLAREVVNSMEVQLTSRRIVFDLPSESLVAAIDTKRIEQVLRNLLDNAIKYSATGSTITLGGRRRGTEILVWISDEGIGIQPAALDKIFERFYRADNEFTRQTRGVGLGLAVSRGFVEAHGGRIWAESTPSEGSTFFITLPIDQDEQEN
ncbi:MAG: ATP-binding protein [Anaerolineae bacterium]